MSTTQSTASPRASRGQHAPRGATQTAPDSNGRHSQRRPRGNRANNQHAHNNAAGASPSKPPRADPSFSESAVSGEDVRPPTGRSSKKHTRSQPSTDRSSVPVSAQATLTDTEAPRYGSATPAKVQGAYAGPTFHASPAPSALPIPKFLSRSVPAKTQSGPPTPPPEDSDSGNTGSPSPSPSRAPIAIPARNDDSPLDMLFRADKAERAKNANFSPASNSMHRHYNQDSAVFPIELDGESKNIYSPSPPFASPGAHRSTTDPSKVPQLKDNRQPDQENDVMQDLFQRLSMSQKKPVAGTPPRPSAQVPGSPLRHQTPPYHNGRPSVSRSVSGPTTPAAPAQDPADFFYGNRNLSPLFKAAQDDTPKRNSGLRTEVTADSPTVAVGFNDFPSIAPPQAMDPHAFARGHQGNNGRRSSVPHRQGHQGHQQPPNHQVTKTPGRYQPRPNAHQYPRGNANSPNFRAGKPATGPSATPTKPATTMMSFVPASVSAKPKAQAAAPPVATPPMKTSTPDSLALEQDLKRLLNLNMTGDVTGVR
jgi:hypothetical protein